MPAVLRVIRLMIMALSRDSHTTGLQSTAGLGYFRLAQLTILKEVRWVRTRFAVFASRRNSASVICSRYEEDSLTGFFARRTKLAELSG